MFIGLLSVPESESCSVVSDSLQPHGLYSPWNSPGQNTGVGRLSLLQGIFPTQGSNSGLLHCRQISLSSVPQGKPKNTGVGSLFLLQQIFPTQESNPGFLRCRRILTELSGKPVLATSQTLWHSLSQDGDVAGVSPLLWEAQMHKKLASKKAQEMPCTSHHAPWTGRAEKEGVWV